MTAAELEALSANAPEMLGPATAAIAGMLAASDGEMDSATMVAGLVGAIAIVAGGCEHTAHVLFAAINGLQRAMTVVLAAQHGIARAAAGGQSS